MDVSSVIPCLNEEESVGAVINEILGSNGLKRFSFEIVVADNGSTDRSVEIAEGLGARVTHIQQRGYGAAVRGGAFFDEAPMWLYRQHERNQIGASAQSGSLSRLYKGWQKSNSIVKNRFLLKDDPVIRQGRLFLEAANERWLSDVLKNDVLSRELSRTDRIQLLRPATLLGSSLESLRVAISQQK